mgnify:CR=1 FL=1
MNGYQTYLLYQSLKLHFTNESYDATRYNFKTSTKESTFRHRKDRFFFQRIGTKYKTGDRIIDYFTSNFTQGVKWVGDMREENLNQFDKKMDSLTYEFGKNINILHGECDSFDKICNSSITLDLLMANTIDIETVTIIDLLVNFCDTLKKNLHDPLTMYDSQFQKIYKYKLLLRRRNLPYNKLKNTIRKVFTN